MLHYTEHRQSSTSYLHPRCISENGLPPPRILNHLTCDRLIAPCDSRVGGSAYRQPVNYQYRHGRDGYVRWASTNTECAGDVERAALTARSASGSEAMESSATTPFRCGITTRTESIPRSMASSVGQRNAASVSFNPPSSATCRCRWIQLHQAFQLLYKQLNFHGRAQGQRGDGDCGSRRKGRVELARVDRIHLCKIFHVGQIHAHPHHVGERFPCHS